jgi:hypothetical protein
MGTFGFKPVYLAGRLQSVDPADVDALLGPGGWMPIAFLVPLAAITPFSPALPPDFTWIAPGSEDCELQDARTCQIRERQIYQSEKYAPW